MVPIEFIPISTKQESSGVFKGPTMEKVLCPIVLDWYSKERGVISGSYVIIRKPVNWKLRGDHYKSKEEKGRA